MRIITINLNGIRSAAEKTFFEWLTTQNADFVCIQETKAQEHQLSDALFQPKNYHSYYFDAEKKGYSGTAIYSMHKPIKVINGFGLALADKEGRYLQIDFDNLSIISLYMPSGSSGPEKQANKFTFMQHFLPHLQQLKQQAREIIICGDWNIAHKEIDLKNWRPNQKNSGFLPEERAWLTQVFDELGYVDAFRVVNQASDQYTWWSNRGRAYEKNVGWRIDYQIITPNLKSAVKDAAIYKEKRFSDHAPLIIDYDYSL